MTALEDHIRFARRSSAESVMAEPLTAAVALKALDRLAHVPGLTKCDKCGFSLVSNNLHAETGQVSARDEPSVCPNDGTPLRRVTEREAGNEAAGRPIPMVLENVKGAQPWVGRAGWNFGSYYLWGDIPALMPPVLDARKVPGFRFDGSGKSFQTASVEGMKNAGGSWFNVGSPGQKVTGQNPAHAIAREVSEGHKHRDVDGYERTHPQAFGWKVPRTTSKGKARKAASAKIAKIPEALSRHIARVYLPQRAAA